MRKLGIVIAFALSASALVHVPAAGAAPAPIRVYIFAGQSNMTGAATMEGELPTVAPELQVPDSNILFWGPTTDMPSRWAALQPPTEMRKNIFGAGLGPEVSAGRELSALHPGTRIAVVKTAWNGTTMYWDWNSRRQLGLYKAMIVQVRYAVAKLHADTGAPVEIAGFFWMQGESDSDTKSHATMYGARLREFIASVRRDFGVKHLPFVVGQVDDLRPYHSRGPTPYSPIVGAEQWKVAHADPDTFLVPTTGLARNSLSPVHFSTKGTVDLGRRFVRPGFRL